MLTEHPSVTDNVQLSIISVSNDVRHRQACYCNKMLALYSMHDAVNVDYMRRRNVL